MRISAKGRYALASVIYMAEKYDGGEYLTAISISDKLGISKIYLEQIFSFLKKGGLVSSIKGSQGGYQLSRMPRHITVLDVLSSVELSLFETAEESVAEKAPEIDKAMRLSVFDAIDREIKETLGKITLEDMIADAQKYKEDGGMMFYI